MAKKKGSSKRYVVVAVAMYVFLLVASSVYMCVQVLQEQWHIDAFLEEEHCRHRSWLQRQQQQQQQEGFDIAKEFQKLGDLGKGIKQIQEVMKVVVDKLNQVRTLAPRLVHLSAAVKYAHDGVTSEGKSVETGVLAGFEWFKRHVKWIDRIGDCWDIFIINGIFSAIGGVLYAVLAAITTFSSFLSGVPIDLDGYLAQARAGLTEWAHAAGLHIPQRFSDCTACRGCASQADIDYKLQVVAPAHHSNAKTYFQRADCAIQQAVS